MFVCTTKKNSVRKCDFLFQSIPRWPSVTAVVTPNPSSDSPFPAEVNLKWDTQSKEDQFWFVNEILDHQHGEVADDKIEGNVYVADSLKHQMRLFIESCFVMTLSRFNLEYNHNLKCYEFIFMGAAPIFRAALEKDFMEMLDKRFDGDRVREIIKQYVGVAHFVDLCIHACDGISAHQNWDIPAAYVGTSMANMACLINGANDITVDFRDHMPYATKLTGQGYGSSMNTYVTYMANTTVKNFAGKSEWVLDHDTFVDENHSELVIQALHSHEILPDNTLYPIPRPTKSLRADWVVTYGGATLLLGEGKSGYGTDTEEGIDLALFCGVMQLAFVEVGIVVHSTGRHFRVYKLTKNPIEHRIKIVERKGTPYTYVSPRHKVEKYGPAPRHKKLPEIGVVDGQNGPRDESKGGKREVRDMIVDKWNKLHRQLKDFGGAFLEAVDMIVGLMALQDYKEAGARFEKATLEGRVDPITHWPNTEGHFGPHRKIHDQDRFKYCEPTLGRMRTELDNIAAAGVSDFQLGAPKQEGSCSEESME